MYRKYSHGKYICLFIYSLFSLQYIYIKCHRLKRLTVEFHTDFSQQNVHFESMIASH